MPASRIVGRLYIDNTTSVNREKVYLVFLSTSAAWQTILKLRSVSIAERTAGMLYQINTKTNTYVYSGRVGLLHILKQVSTRYVNRGKNGYVCCTFGITKFASGAFYIVKH